VIQLDSLFTVGSHLLSRPH